MQLCNVRLASTVEWKDCEELKPKPTEKWVCVIKKGSKEASDGVVYGSEQVSVCEMRKKQQKDEDARGM